MTKSEEMAKKDCFTSTRNGVVKWIFTYSVSTFSCIGL